MRNGISADDKNVPAILDAKTMMSAKEVKSFLLGLLTHYNDFLDHMSDLAEPLHELT